jgi:hypothetical protein
MRNSFRLGRSQSRTRSPPAKGAPEHDSVSVATAEPSSRNMLPRAAHRRPIRAGIAANSKNIRSEIALDADAPPPQPFDLHQSTAGRFAA